MQKDVAGIIVRYVYDGDDIRLEYSSSTSPLARYSYGDGVDEPLSAERGGARYFYHANHLGSIRHLTDASGAVVNTYDYDAFGKATVATASVPQPFGFTGREADPESGLMHYRARAYDPSTGRFLQEDPIGFAGGDLNVYAYVGNAPLRYVDPSGLNAEGAAVRNASAGAAGGTGIYALRAGLSCVFLSVLSAARAANDGLTIVEVKTSLQDGCGVSATGKARVLINKQAGKLLEEALAEAISELSGCETVLGGKGDKRTNFKTPKGFRYVDIAFCILGPDGVEEWFNVEVKKGKSKYKDSQREKDQWIFKKKQRRTILFRYF